MNAWLVRGADPILVGDAVRQLTHELSGDDPAAVEEISGDAATVAAIVEACQTPPFLTTRRVVVARDVGRFSSEDLVPLLKWLAEPLPTTALVLGDGGGRLSVRLANAAKKYGTVVDTSVGTRAKERSAWLDGRLADAPVHLDRAATARLADHLGEDVARLASLLDVLAAAYGEGSRVGEAQLEPFLGEAGGVAPWDLTDAIDQGRKARAKALAQLHRMLEGGARHPLVLMATLHRHYAAMLRLDGAEVAGEQAASELVGMAPYPARKVLEQGRRLGSAGVARAIELLAEADINLKGARDWPGELVLEVLVVRLCDLRGGR